MSLLQRTLQASARIPYQSSLRLPRLHSLSPSPRPALTNSRRYRGEVLGSRPTPITPKTILVGDPTATVKPDGTAIQTKESLPYLVKRTSKSGWLPVYREFKNGKTQTLTIIRRVDGNVKQLADDLGQFVPSDRIEIKELQRHIVLKGDYLFAVRDWLTARGF
ncbi:hypothetical protein SpCBS45565_g01302 [Spizellomyces sp. 'palustris']|nr:hypothetical protein SpCBS45565_g01302 [Spizellomyces sp. 'palustris']